MIKIIVVHYGRIEITLNCLSSLLLSDLRYLSDLILVNNSSVEIKKILPKKFKRVKVINNRKNLGYAGALNIGIKFALKSNPRYLFILNNDAILEKNCLVKLINFSQKNKTDLTSPKILDENGNIWFCGGEIDKKRFTAGHKKGKLDFLSGCCLLVKKEVFETIGFFDEEYFMYYEDVDFCLRARKAGFKLGLTEKAIVYHQTKRTQKGKKLMEYYLARNHLLFVKKHAPLWVKIREFIRLPKTLWEHYHKKEWEALTAILRIILFKDHP